MQTTTSAELIRHLAHRGLDRVFLVPGESYLGIMDALYDHPSVSTNICRHESGAGFMAVSDAKLTGRPALVCVSRGPGLTNASIALHTAQQDAVPLICVIGQIPAADVRKGAFQEIDYQLMLGGICKRVIEIREAADFVRAANTAWDVATEGTPGPVAIVIPEDLQDLSLEQAPLVQSQTARPAISRSDLESLQRAVAQARRPVIIAGGQMKTEAGRAALDKLATSLGAPVLISFRRQHAIDFNHPNYCGELGLAPSTQILKALEEADCVLALGTRLGDICSQGYALFDGMPATQTLWHISQHLEDYRHRHPDMRRLGVDPVDAAERIVAVGINGERRADWLGRFQAMHEAHTTIAEWKHEAGAVDFRCAPDMIRKHIQGQANVVVDAGTFAAPFYRYLRTSQDVRLL
nr:pyruvate decarboxylase [Pseudomonas sp.]